MKKIVIILLLLLTACTNTGQSQTYTGTDGVNLEFISSQPPSTVYDNTEFPISLRVTNNGAYDIEDENNPIIISSNLASAYHIQPVNTEITEDKEITLEGKRGGRRGEQTTMLLGQFTSANTDRTLQEGKEEIIIDACYPYTTTFSSSICARNDFSLTDNTVCQPRETYRFRSQGAPIAVTEIKPLLTPQGTNNEGVTEFVPEYVITVQNRGSGTPSISGPDKCNNPSLQNAVQVSASINGNHLSCQDEELQLSGGEGEITCQTVHDQPALRSNYQALIDVNITYDYTASVSKELSVRPRQR